MAQRAGNRLGDLGISQVAGAGALIEVRFHSSAEEFREALPLVGGNLAPCLLRAGKDVFSLGLKAAEHGSGKGIRKAEGDEVHGALSFPVRETAAVANGDFAEAGAGCPRYSPPVPGDGVAFQWEIGVGTGIPR